MDKMRLPAAQLVCPLLRQAWTKNIFSVTRNYFHSLHINQSHSHLQSDNNVLGTDVRHGKKKLLTINILSSSTPVHVPFQRHLSLSSHNKYKHKGWAKDGIVNQVINTTDTGRRHLAHILGCEDVQALETLAELFPPSAGLEVLTASLIQEKVNTFLSFGLPIALLHKFPRFLTQTSTAELHRRLSLFQERGFLEDVLGEQAIVKEHYFGHYMESNSLHFQAAWRELCANQDALEGHRNQFEYIKFRLNTTSAITEKLMQKTYLKRGMSQSRVKMFLDFILLEAKLSPDFVINYLSIIGYSVERTRLRFLVFKKANSGQITDHGRLYHALKLSQKQFREEYDDVINRLSKSNREVRLFFNQESC